MNEDTGKANIYEEEEKTILALLKRIRETAERCSDKELTHLPELINATVHMISKHY